MCWGANGHGQIGDGTIEQRNTPTPVVTEEGPALGPLARLAAGAAHSCGLLDSGQLWCWGTNDQGQLSLDASAQAYVALPRPVPGPPALECAPRSSATLALGSDHGCVIDTEERLWCWGANDAMQLGTGLTGYVAWRTQPVVNSAGAGVWRFLEETSPEQIVEMMGAPYLAAANTSRAFMASMLAAGRGHLIHVGSPASVMPWAGATAYTASRWALRGLHEALHMDLAGTGVDTSLVYLGEVSSEYFEANPDSHQHIPTIGSWIPVSTPERCAEVILGVVRRPRRVVFYPFALRLMAWMAAISPGPTRRLIVRTGRRH